MKKFLLMIFLLLSFCMPVFSADSNSIFVSDITKDQVKKAIIGRAISTGWQVKQDNEYTLDIYRVKNDTTSMMLYGTSQNMHPEQRVHFTLFEKDKGVYLTHTTNIAINPNSGLESLKYAPILDVAVTEMLKDLFIGNYSYNINYKIKKEYVLISDTPLTSYADKNRIGSQQYRKATKIDDKNIDNYKKSELKLLFNKCEKDQIKIEVKDELGANTYYLIRTYTPPTYKQFL